MPILDVAATSGEGTGAGRGDGAALRGTGGVVAAPAGGPELQGSQFVTCRNGRSAAGLKLTATPRGSKRPQYKCELLFSVKEESNKISNNRVKVAPCKCMSV
jgi:hypothetical protein